MNNTESAYRRGFQHGATKAGDAILEQNGSREDFVEWEKQIAEWRSDKTNQFDPPGFFTGMVNQHSSEAA